MWVCNNQPSSVLHALTDISFLIDQLVWNKKTTKFICWLIRTDLLGVCRVRADEITVSSAHLHVDDERQKLISKFFRIKIFY